MPQDNDSPFERFAQRIAKMAYEQELKNARMLGLSLYETYLSAFHVLDETYLACFAPHRQFVFRVCRNGGWW